MRLKVLLLVLTILCCVYFSSISALGTITSVQNVVNEGESVQLCVNLDPLEDVTVTLSVATFAGTVVEGLDFSLSSNSILFTADGTNDKCIDFVALEDDFVESEEFVRVGLGGVPLGDPESVLITISDTSRIDVSFTSASYTGNEDAGAVQVCAIIVGGGIERAVSVTIVPEETGTAISNEDFASLGDSEMFNPLSSSDPVCVNIGFLSDNVIEEMETFSVRLSGGLEAVNVVMETATIFITDSDGASLTVSPALIELPEGDGGLTDVNIGIVVTLNGNTLDRNITVLANTVDAQATAENNDFIPLVNEPVTIPSTISDGETFTFTAHIVGDMIQEIIERFNIEFTAANSNDQFGTDRVIVRILDDADTLNDCGSLADPTNGEVTISPSTIQGSVATYSCIVGYNLVGLENRNCLNSGWEGEPATCEIVNCGDLTEPDQGSILISNSDYEGQAIYICNSGYELDSGTPTVTRRCELNGMWSGEPPQCVRVSCGFLTEPANAIITYPNGDTLFGQIARYSCDPGYNLEGTPERVCRANRVWSLTAPSCQPVNCGELTNPVNGNVMVSSNFFPGVATYSCNTNFELVNGPEERQCQASSSWSDNAPTCQVIECPALVDPSNGTVNIQVSIDGTTVATYTCDEGFEVNGTGTRMCQPNSQWSGADITCDIVVCPDQVAPTDGSVEVGSTTFLSVAMYQCDDGFTLRGSVTAVCQSNGMWNSPPPFCDIVSCPVLTDPTDGSVTFTDAQLVFNSEASYTCDAGFLLVGESSVRVCQATGEWSGDPPTCQLVSCPVLTNPTDGSVTFSDAQLVFNSEASYICDAGFVLVGESSVRVCQATGEWSGDPPTCLLGCNGVCTCPELEVSNSTINATNSNFIGSMANIECSENYTLVGNDSLTCNSSGAWSDEIPSCVLACPNITVSNGNANYTNDTLPGSLVTVTCDSDYTLLGPESRTCNDTGVWLDEENSCVMSIPPTGGQLATLGTPTIIGIAVGGVAFLLILIGIIIISIAVCCTIRKKKIYQKYVLPYRSYIYANTQRTSSGPLSDAEIRQWESQTRQHAVEAVDALEKT